MCAADKISFCPCIIFPIFADPHSLALSHAPSTTTSGEWRLLPASSCHAVSIQRCALTTLGRMNCEVLSFGHLFKHLILLHDLLVPALNVRRAYVIPKRPLPQNTQSDVQAFRRCPRWFPRRIYTLRLKSHAHQASMYTRSMSGPVFCPRRPYRLCYTCIPSGHAIGRSA